VAHYLSYIFCIAPLSLLTLTTARNICNPPSQLLDLDLLTSIEQRDMTTHTSNESIFDRKTFSQTRLGRLPIELLQNVTRHLNKHDLTAVGRISPELQTLAERRLSQTFICPMWQKIMGSEKETTWSTGLFVRRCRIGRTLPKKVSSMDIIAQDVQHDVEVTSM
jgi:hypothetical protein